ncbi:WD40 repeat domain-containing protein [Spirillospora sp. CA-255316]
MPGHDDLYRPPDGDHGDRVTAVAISPDGALGATGARSGEVRFWDLRYGSLRASVGGVGDRPVTGAVFTGEAELVTAGCGASRWTLADGRLEWRRVGEEMRAGALILGHGGRSAMVADGGDLRWWALDGSWHGRFQWSGTLDALALAAPDLIITGQADGRVSAWRMPPADRWSDPVLVWGRKWSEPARQWLLRGCDRGRLVVSPRREGVAVLDAASGETVSVFAPDERPTAIAAFPDAPLVVLGGRDGSLTWWDARTGHRLGRVRAHEGRVRALALAPLAGLVLSAAQDGTAALWRMHARRPLARFAPAPADRPAVPHGHEDPWALTAAAGTPDGRRWLVGGAGGQVHILARSRGGGLVPDRVGRPSRPAAELDVEILLEDVRAYWADGPAAVRAARILGRPGALEGKAAVPRAEVVGALETLVARPGDPGVREAAVIALAEIDRDAATTALYRMFDRPDGTSAGTAGRLLEHFTGEAAPTTEELIASLPGIGNFLGVLTSAALAERGAAAVPALHDALRAFPIPARQDGGTWMRDETTKYRLMAALLWIGPAAAPATPTLLAILEDGEIYRDTRHKAEVTLQAIGLPETADVVAAEVRRRAEAPEVACDVHDDPDEDCDDCAGGEGFSLLLEALAGMPPEALAASGEVGAALAALRRRFGDGVRTYERDGETHEYTVYEIRLAELVDDKLTGHTR